MTTGLTEARSEEETAELLEFVAGQNTDGYGEVLDKAIDSIRKKHDSLAVQRASFLHSGLKPMTGGTGEEIEYPVMSSLL